jgi:glutamine amidotransferase
VSGFDGSRRVVIIDNGGANTASLQFALERLQCEAQVSADPDRIQAATHVILPGVGAAADSMQRLRERRLDRLLPSLTQPVLGICLGMQLLYEASEEGDTRCLGVIRGTARRLATAPGRPVPHMGWNTLSVHRETPLLRGLRSGMRAYFVHSYAVPVGNETIASSDYGEPFSAVVAWRNWFGTQFHPERSGPIGAELLCNFLRAA